MSGPELVHVEYGRFHPLDPCWSIAADIPGEPGPVLIATIHNASENLAAYLGSMIGHHLRLESVIVSRAKRCLKHDDKTAGPTLRVRPATPKEASRAIPLPIKLSAP